MIHGRISEEQFSACKCPCSKRAVIVEHSQSSRAPNEDPPRSPHEPLLKSGSLFPAQELFTSKLGLKINTHSICQGITPPHIDIHTATMASTTHTGIKIASNASNTMNQISLTQNLRNSSTRKISWSLVPSKPRITCAP